MTPTGYISSVPLPGVSVPIFPDKGRSTGPSWAGPRRCAGPVPIQVAYILSTCPFALESAAVRSRSALSRSKSAVLRSRSAPACRILFFSALQSAHHAELSLSLRTVRVPVLLCVSLDHVHVLLKLRNVQHYRKIPDPTPFHYSENRPQIQRRGQLCCFLREPRKQKHIDGVMRKRVAERRWLGKIWGTGSRCEGPPLAPPEYRGGF